MNSKNFETIEGLCESLTSSYTAIEECLDELNPRTRHETSVVSCIRNELNNIRDFRYRIYGVCEDSYVDEQRVNVPAEVLELAPMLPNKFSLGEWESLKEHINKWREENGHPQYCE